MMKAEELRCSAIAADCRKHSASGLELLLQEKRAAVDNEDYERASSLTSRVGEVAGEASLAEVGAIRLALDMTLRRSLRYGAQTWADSVDDGIWSEAADQLRAAVAAVVQSDDDVVSEDVPAAKRRRVDDDEDFESDIRSRAVELNTWVFGAGAIDYATMEALS
jgi:hypothetical protein